MLINKIYFQIQFESESKRITAKELAKCNKILFFLCLKFGAHFHDKKKQKWISPLRRIPSIKSKIELYRFFNREKKKKTYKQKYKKKLLFSCNFLNYGKTKKKVLLMCGWVYKIILKRKINNCTITLFSLFFLALINLK